MAWPTVPYNATTGSDTAPSDSDGSGTNGDISSTTLTLNETVDFTGVADDDSDYLWYEGNAGDRHLFQITAFNPSVAACTSLTLAIAASAARTAKNWYVNGTRKTLKNDTSRYDWEDHDLYWQVEFDAGTYDVPAAVTLQTAYYAGTRYPPNAWYAKSGAASRPVISFSANANIAFENNSTTVVFKGLKFLWAGGLDQSNTYFNPNRADSYYRFEDCVFDASGVSAANQPDYYIYSSAGDANIFLIDCYFAKGTVRDQVNNFGGDGCCYIYGCRFDGTDGTSSFWAINWVGASLVVRDCLFIDSDGGGITFRHGDGVSLWVTGCTFADNASSAIVLDNVASSGGYHILNNIFAYNGGYGISILDTTNLGDELLNLLDYNAYYSNTSGEVHSSLASAQGSNEVTLSADPFTDRASDDYTLNDTAGGGAACQGAGFPGAFPDGT